MGKDESISDKEWERFLRDAEAGTPGAPEEPSARARSAARLPRGEAGQPPGWRTYEPARPRRGKGWYVLGLLLAVVLLVVALMPGKVLGWFGAGGDDGTPLAAESERPGQPPAAGAGRRPTMDAPFKGSPAAQWGDGTAGIHVPEARATGWMSRDQVAHALDRSRDFLAASSLDPGVLGGDRPAKAIALINPRQADVQDYLTAAFRTPSRENDARLLFSRFDKEKVRLVGHVVKTRGRLTFHEGRRGAVEVTADVTYVYPVVRAGAGGGGDGEEIVRTIVRRETVMSWDDPAKVVTEPGTFSLVSYKADITNGGCDTYTGYFTPPFGADRAGSGNGTEVDPYDRSKPADEAMGTGTGTGATDGGGCRTATRS
ncbi:hypothetical protein AB0A77_00320 [Streptomyces varsoviensis]|uniref:hypothetical protein n=1 Tax=Streptomyces varsoviensis TaxID=67373 RepID=UPI0033E1E472